MYNRYLRSSRVFFVFCILSLLLVGATALSALDPAKKITQYSMKAWNMEAGLPTNTIYAVLQTHDGYLWLGTQDGLVRFDGVEFKPLSLEKNRRSSSRNKIRALYEDQNNTLWIGSTTGGLIYYKDGEFKTFSIPGAQTFSKISSINRDHWGNLWVGSFESGLACIAKDRSTVYTTQNGLPSDMVNSIYKDGKGDLWVTTAAGIVKITAPGEFEEYPPQKDLDFYKVVSLYEEDTGTLWIGTGDGFLYRLKDGKTTAFGEEQGILYPTINFLYRDKDKNLWIGTDGGGLSRMSNGIVSTFTGGDGLAGSSVYAIYEDKEDNLWIGTLDRGLYQLRDGKFTVLTAKEGLAHDDTQCIYEDRAGDIWFGTKGGLSRLRNGRIDTVLTTRNGLLDDSVTCLAEDRQNNFWVGTWGGLHLFQNGKLTAFTTQNGLSDNRVNCILVDNKGNTWVGTENGLDRLDPTGNISVFTTGNGLSGNSVGLVFEDSKGKLLIGTDRGLYEYKDGKIQGAAWLAGIKESTFSCAHEDSEGVLWFGTDSGLVRVKPNAAPPFIYTIASGLVDNHVDSILEDEKGFLWLAGQNGISRVSKKDLEKYSQGKIKQIPPVRYNELDGMKSHWCSGQAIKTRDGRFWFPTMIGAAVVHPGQIENKNTAPALIIEKLTVDGVIMDIHAETRGNKPLRLEAGTKRLEFYYRADTLINPQKLTFKSKLTEYDRDWLDMGNIRKATYTDLDPGEYTFEVEAFDPDNPGEIWGKQHLSFTKKPYFTQTSWFYLLSILTVVLALLLLHWLRVRHLKARKKHLEELVAMRTRDLQEQNLLLEKARQNLQHSKDLIETKNLQLESQTAQLQEQSEKLKEMDRVKNRFFTNISHEFRTPLTLIMGPLEQMLAESTDSAGEDRQRKLGLMLRNSQRLLGLINQLLELSRYESGKARLRAGRQNVIPLLKGITANFKPLAEKRELELSFQPGSEDITLYFEPARLQEVMENLLINAIKFTPPGGRITITAERNTAKDRDRAGEFLRISITDTGPGIPREQLLHVFDRFYQADSSYENRRRGTGIGLALVRELVQLHHGTIDVYSHEGKGTEFIISLPMGDAHLQPDEIAGPGETPGSERIPSAAAGAQSESTNEVSARTAAVEIRPLEFADAEETVNQEEFDPLDPLKEEKEIILVIEDSADVREYVRGALEPLYAVVEAKDGLEGLQKAREIIPDLIISDILMPGMDGLELCKTLKTGIETSHIPIILLTARASEAGIIQGLETGADDYITKPFSTRILAARIKNLIEIRRQLQMNLNREMVLQPVKESVSGLDKEFLKKLRGVIRQNLAEVEFNVEHLAREMGMDRSTVYRKVLALTGEPPTEFIRSCRLKRGAELLKSNFGTVLEVALEVGFSSANYFTKCFKKKFQQLPSAFQAAES